VDDEDVAIGAGEVFLPSTAGDFRAGGIAEVVVFEMADFAA
jgi:hypothetical protein